jgi:F0F1-type ATP synthase assembly protein I
MRLGFSVVGGLAVGFLLDRWLNTSPVLTLIGLVLGMGGAAYTIWTISKRYLGG